MAAAPHAAPALRRDPSRRVVAGVAAGIARRLGIDVLLVRLTFVGAIFAGGAGVGLYLLLWIFIPAEPGAAGAARRRTGRGDLEVALGVGLLVLSALLAFRALGLWFGDAVAWPVVLVAAGAALVWRASDGGAPNVAAVTSVTALKTAAPDAGTPSPSSPRTVAVSHTSVGVVLVVAAGVAFLQLTGALAAAREVLLVAFAVTVGLGVILGPWIMRLARSLAAERAGRIRSQERAELAAHLHDSVLQTLALVQQRADDPRAVATLARRQERELRSWLAGRTADEGSDRRLSAALEAAAEEVERRHGVAVEVVSVGDAELDEAGEAIVAAAREAMVNAAKFGGDGPVDVYAEAGDGRVHVFVRDRGPGFAPADVPVDRRGVRESIVGRMARHGGRATITAAPGAGTEVELVLERGSP